MKTISETDFHWNFREQLVYANFNIRPDVLDYFHVLSTDPALSDRNRKITEMFIDNAEFAANERRAVCQDSGYVQVYVKLGYQVHLDFNINQAIQDIVAGTYKAFYLRSSIAHPITRENTRDNTPAFINTEITDGDSLEVTIMLKGGGSENVTKSGLLLPTSSRTDIINWIVEAVKAAGSKACPPYIVGVGIGGTLEKATGLSKKSLLDPIGERSTDSIESGIELAALAAINRLPIGFQGLRFGTTAMDVKVRTLPCHIATLPIAVSLGCNAIRQGYFAL